MTKMTTKIILPILGGMLLFGATAVPNGGVLYAAPKEDSSTTKAIDAQQEALEIAKAKIKEITGNDYEVVFAGKDQSTMIFKTKNNKSDSILVSSKGEIAHLSLTFSYNDLKETKLQEKLDKAWTELFPNEDEPLQNVTVNMFTGFATEVKASNSKGMIALKDGKLSYGGWYAMEKEISPDALEAADQVLKRIGKGLTKTGRDLKVVVKRPGESSVYGFEYTTNKGKVRIDIEEKSLVPVRISMDENILSNGKKEDYEAEQKKINSLDINKLGKAAKQEAETIMKLDLSGYNVAKSKYQNDVLVFSKKGASDVQVSFTGNGSFHTFLISKYNSIVLPTDPVKL
ncbi:MAG: hypothetical protein IKE29_09770 [Paenibacillus sp.]|uniref:hypothetical protein n=1 Tax=Paenibacillus sp. TaxID=58172 RepID=UPI0025D2A7A8|nr:hypothetical protein [Paenibacillus sp.]MBR2564900.1 hypothetical protein [Paenibacillus sp.]